MASTRLLLSAGGVLLLLLLQALNSSPNDRAQAAAMLMTLNLIVDFMLNDVFVMNE